MSCAEVERRAEEDEVVVVGRRSRNRASLRTNRSRVEGSGEDEDEEFYCRESCSKSDQNHAYGASRRVCQFAGERGKSWPLGGLRLLGTIEKWFSRILEPARAIAAGRTQAKGAWQSTAWSAAKPANAMDC